MQEETIFIPMDWTVQRAYVLARTIPAIRLESPGRAADGKAKLGSILRLPVGSNVEVCGPGFNGRTVKVCCEHSYYFVFQEDLGMV